MLEHCGKIHSDLAEVFEELELRFKVLQQLFFVRLRHHRLIGKGVLYELLCRL